MVSPTHATLLTSVKPASQPWQRAGLVLLLALIVVLLVLPFFLPRGQLFFWQRVLIFAMYAQSVALLVGFSGLISFGQAAYFGLGAYTIGLLLPLSPAAPLGLILAILVGALVALVVGAIILRSTGLAFGMLTLAFGQALYQLTFVFKDITGGENGIPGILRGSFLGLNLGNPVIFWYFGLFWVALGVAFLALVHASPFGLTLRLIRDDPKRASFLGIPVFRYRLGAYVIAGALGALAGSLYAYLSGIVTQDLLYWTLSGDPLIMSLIGGLYAFWGPAAGAVIFIWVQDQLAKQTAAWILYQGLVFLVFVLFLPEGLASLPRRYRLWRARRLARREQRAAAEAT
ncbi:MAG: hypothetical protein KatS3mg061_0611 [Dehalococcoidia bacterium]|nr:MAG: hypothetical protein KatS3mg061_0611 [Dehalococcoidia bacterium]